MAKEGEEYEEVQMESQVHREVVVHEERQEGIGMEEDEGEGEGEGEGEDEDEGDKEDEDEAMGEGEGQVWLRGESDLPDKRPATEEEKIFIEPNKNK